MSHMPITPEDYDAVHTALAIISRYGHLISSEECADIAHKGLLGDVSWLMAWEAPDDGS